MPRFRTISQAYEFLKSTDDETAVTEHALRQLVVSGRIPSVRMGKKYLLDLDALLALFSLSPAQDRSLDFGGRESDV
mgnify:CR=1 FL=1